MSVVGNRILTIRKQLGLTQQELAEKMGYKTKSAINKIELGLRDVSQSKIMHFARVLNTTPSYLMGWTDNQDENIKITKEEQQLIDLIHQLNEDEVNELSNFVDYIISKRK